jgi:hypothetical protein
MGAIVAHAFQAALLSLGRNLALDSASGVFRTAAESIAHLHPGMITGDLFRRMTSPDEHHASLRGRLLLMEIPCPNLKVPFALYLLGTAADVFWRGAALRLFLFGFYRPEEVGSYGLISAQLFRERLTPENIASWQHGRFWPEDAR